MDSITTVARSIDRGEAKLSVVLEGCLARISVLQPIIQALALATPVHARRQSELLESELLSSGPRSALHGLPVVVKDNIDVATLQTRAGSRVLADASPPTMSAPVVRNLISAGSIIVGKARLPEFAIGAVTPKTRSPVDPSRIAGGSSGGSAAAVASGMCYAALGTDTGGSIRIPSAACGVVGLKPRPGTISSLGVLPCSPELDTVGPITRSVSDLAITWQVMTGGRAITRGGPLVVGRVRDEALGETDPVVRYAFNEAVDRLISREDIRVVEVSPPPFEQWHPFRRVPLLQDVLAAHSRAGWYPAMRAMYTPRLQRFLDRAALLDAAEISAARKALKLLRQKLLEGFARCDVLVLPTLACLPPRWSEIVENDETDQPEVDRELTRLCAPFNFLPVAALSMPCWNTGGHLVSLQIVARTEWMAIECALRVEESASLAKGKRRLDGTKR